MLRLLSLTAVVLGLGLVAGPGFTAEVKYALTGTNTKITFVGEKKGGKHDGGFKALTGSATINDVDITTLKIALEIDMNSTYTDVEKLTDHLKSPDFFEVKANPKSKFESTKIVKSGDGYTVTGKLTLRGKTKEISFPAKIEATGTGLTLASSFTINRHDYGVAYGKGVVFDDVKLKVELKATK
jgi:polyisoprenoid-binding protein YceI